MDQYTFNLLGFVRYQEVQEQIDQCPYEPFIWERVWTYLSARLSRRGTARRHERSAAPTQNTCIVSADRMAKTC
jgi:hypothetical protein